MTSRERVLKALNHQQPDRVPVDLGSTTATGISASSLNMLRKLLKLEDRVVKVHEPYQLLGYVEDDILKLVGADVIGLWSLGTWFGYRNAGWKPWRLPDGTEVLVGTDFMVKQDAKGDYFIYPQGDINVPPCAKLPKDGFYFDNIVRQEEVDEDHLDGKRDFGEQFKEISDYDLRYIEDKADNLYNNTEYAIVGHLPGGGLGSLAYIPGPAQKKTPGIRKAEDWYMAHILHPKYIKEIFEYQTEIAIKNLELYKQAVGNKIQAIFISGTDFGSQKSEMMSSDMFKEFYCPYYKKMNDWVHKNTTWKTFYHSCGSVVRLLDDFVDCGVDILNPVQCSASGMDPQFLKDKYGEKLVFWGGGIDTQKTLPFGTPEEVKKEAFERLNIFSKGGGYVFSAIHNIQATTPIENIATLFDTVKSFNKNP